MQNVLKPLAKYVLIPLGLTAPTSIDDAIQRKIFGPGMTALISNEEMDDIMKIIKSLEESGLLIRSGSKTIRNKAKEQRDRFLCMLLDTLVTSLLGNL